MLKKTVTFCQFLKLFVFDFVFDKTPANHEMECKYDVRGERLE